MQAYKTQLQKSPRKLAFKNTVQDEGMTNSALSQSLREKSVANMMATLRIEKLSPSESLQSSLHAYVEGKKTTDDLLNEVRAKYLALGS